MLDALRRPHRRSPEELLAADPEEMRAAAGLSRAKVIFLRSLAEHVIDGSIELEKLDDLPDEEVIAELIAIKGLGQWSADMFLMFHLGRPDVLPVGDLGIRKAVMIEYRLRKLPDPKRLAKIAKPWRPWRTIACTTSGARWTTSPRSELAARLRQLRRRSVGLSIAAPGLPLLQRREVGREVRAEARPTGKQVVLAEGVLEGGRRPAGRGTIAAAGRRAGGSRARRAAGSVGALSRPAWRAPTPVSVIQMLRALLAAARRGQRRCAWATSIGVAPPT